MKNTEFILSLFFILNKILNKNNIIIIILFI